MLSNRDVGTVCLPPGEREKQHLHLISTITPASGGTMDSGLFPEKQMEKVKARKVLPILLPPVERNKSPCGEI